MARVCQTRGRALTLDVKTWPQTFPKTTALHTLVRVLLPALHSEPLDVDSVVRGRAMCAVEAGGGTWPACRVCAPPT